MSIMIITTGSFVTEFPRGTISCEDQQKNQMTTFQQISMGFSDFGCQIQYFQQILWDFLKLV